MDSPNLDKFKREFLQANTWVQRKDGVPLYLLEKLSIEERSIAEHEMIRSLSLNDTWPIMGLAHIKSRKALPKLYDLLDQSKEHYKITLAYAIYQICNNGKMIDIVLDELPKITDQHRLIEIMYLLTAFNNEKITESVIIYLDDEDYLVAYNAARALGLSTDDIVQKFRIKKS